MRHKKTAYTDARWVERGPLSAGLTRSWDTWKVGVRTLVAELGIETSTTWWSIEVRLTRSPRREELS